jgi:hypothetical protein
MSEERISDDLVTDIRVIARELFGRDDRSATRRVHYLCNELPAEQRLRGLFRVGSRICMLKSVVRAELERRARGEMPADGSKPPSARRDATEDNTTTTHP